MRSSPGSAITCSIHFLAASPDDAKRGRGAEEVAAVVAVDVDARGAGFRRRAAVIVGLRGRASGSNRSAGEPDQPAAGTSLR